MYFKCTGTIGTLMHLCDHTNDKYVRCFNAVAYHFILYDVSFEELLRVFKMLDDVIIPGLGRVPAQDFLLAYEENWPFIWNARSVGSISTSALTELANWVLGRPTDPDTVANFIGLEIVNI